MPDKWEGNGWTTYQKLVLAELERHGEKLEKLEAHLNRVEIEIAMLKVKSGAWGLMGGAVPVVIMLLVEFLKK